jgi:dCMP deaminase
MSLHKSSKKIKYFCNICKKPFFLKKKISHIPKCQKCLKKYAIERYKKAQYHRLPRYKEKFFGYRLKHSYNITKTDYDQKLQQQNGVCCICKKPDPRTRLSVDHDHQTNEIRGLLCHSCNRVLGVLKDDVNLFRSCWSYLMQFTPRRSWDDYFLDIAELVALRSKDPSTKVGAVIVRDKIICSTGYNGFPRKVNDNIQTRYNKPEKYLWTIHAEENAIFNAARAGNKIEDAVLYVTPLSPCSSCALSISQAGIKEVVYRKNKVTPQFEESCQKAFEIFNACKVLVRPSELDDIRDQ